MRDECRLNRMQCAVGPGETFDGRNLAAFCLGGEREAGKRPPSIDMDGAGAALTLVAALLGSGQLQIFAQRIEQRHARLDVETTLDTVDREKGFHVGSLPGPEEFPLNARQPLEDERVTAFLTLADEAAGDRPDGA